MCTACPQNSKRQNKSVWQCANEVIKCIKPIGIEESIGGETERGLPGGIPYYVKWGYIVP